MKLGVMSRRSLQVGSSVILPCQVRVAPNQTPTKATVISLRRSIALRNALEVYVPVTPPTRFTVL
jgi:hypothetical protein